MSSKKNTARPKYIIIDSDADSYIFCNSIKDVREKLYIYYNDGADPSFIEQNLKVFPIAEALSVNVKRISFELK